jgi:hypothetical protein
MGSVTIEGGPLYERDVLAGDCTPEKLQELLVDNQAGLLGRHV